MGEIGSDPQRADARPRGWQAVVLATLTPRRLALAAIGVAGVLLPVCMTVANKSSPLLLGVAAALANLAALRAGDGKALLRAHRDLARGASGLFILATIVLAVATTAWSIAPALTLRGLREALPEIVFAWSFAAAGSIVFRRGDVCALGYGLALGAAAILFEAFLGMPLHHLVGARAEDYDLKWSALTLALLLWPSIGESLHRRQWGWALGVVIAVIAAALAAHSSTALCAIAVSGGVFGLARLAPRATLYGFAAFLFVALVVPPWFGQIAGMAIAPSTRAMLDRQHAEHRIEIWTRFGDRVGERLWLGHGFNASFAIGRSDDPADAPIMVSHPHNSFLQVWIELGLVGVVGLGAAIVHLVRRLSILDDRTRAVRLAQLGAVTVLGLVWQNPWRPWWLAALGLAMALFLIERRQRPRADRAG